MPGAKESVVTMAGHFPLAFEHTVKNRSRIEHLNARKAGERVSLGKSKTYAYIGHYQTHLIPTRPLRLVSIVEQRGPDEFRDTLLDVHKVGCLPARLKTLTDITSLSDETRSGGLVSNGLTYAHTERR